MSKAKAIKKPSVTRSLIDMISVFLQALIVAGLVRTFLFQPFYIPSGSMRPTLLVGDYLFASKYAYGYSHYSLPFSPKLFSGRIWAGEPKRGDVVIFRNTNPNNPDDFIKRVIGLPGDRVQMIDGALHINGEPVERERLGVTRDRDMIGGQGNLPVTVYRETLDNGVSYDTFDIVQNGLGDNTQEFIVRPGHYFMMGDNRDNSDDSRFSVGNVPAENLIGRANLIFFSIGNEASAWQIWRWPFDTRWGRIFSFVQTIKDMPLEP